MSQNFKRIKAPEEEAIYVITNFHDCHLVVLSFRRFFLRTIMSWIVLLFYLACGKILACIFWFQLWCLVFFVSEAHLAAEATFCQYSIRQP